MGYVCRRCNFRFQAKEITDCPYCGRKEGVEKEKDARELLDEIDSVLQE